ncbi:putative ent-copalyl diphosphate synthase [Helianthus anomalus]
MPPFVEVDHAIKNYVKSIKSIFGSLDDGVISPSAYDTAWVALIEGVNEQSGGPQFPSSLEWIVNHQLLDGSWGESMIFSTSDRLVNTLACVIALTTWKVHPDKCEKGLNFVEDNIYKLGDQNEEHKTHGLELVFPALIELAGKLDLKVPNDSPVIKEMYKRRERKLLKIPKEKVHNTPTIMIYSLEGLKDLEWDKLLKLQSENGSIVYSPSATAFAFMQTKDQKCLAYLTNLVDKFKGGVSWRKNYYVVFECLRSPHAQDFLLAIPIDGLGQQMSLGEYRTILKYRLMISLFPIDELPGFKYRHDLVRDVLFDIFRRDDIYAKKKAPINFLTDSLEGR